VLHDPDRTILEFDVEAGPRARLGTVTIDGDPLEPLPAFKQRVGVVEGGPCEPAAIQGGRDAYLRRMRAQRRYQASLSYVADAPRDGAVVNLDVTVDPGPVISIAVEGDPVPASKISDLVPLEREGSASQDLIEDSARRIRDYLYDQGYWKADVTSERRPAAGALAIVFTVRKGPVFHVADGGLTISGNNAVGIGNLPASPAGLQPGRPFVLSTLEGVVGAIKARYLELGYSSVKVVADPQDVSTARSGGLVRPVIVVTEGPKVAIGEVTFENNVRFPDEVLRAAIEASQPGTVRPNLNTGDPYFAPHITEARDRLVLRYLNDGYAAVQVTVDSKRSADGARIDLTFRIDEGPQT